MSVAMAEVASNADHKAVATKIESWFHEGLSVMVFRDCDAEDRVSFRLVLGSLNVIQFEEPIPVSAHPSMQRIFLGGGSFAASALEHLPSAQACLAGLSAGFAAIHEKVILDGGLTVLEAAGFERKGVRL